MTNHLWLILWVFTLSLAAQTTTAELVGTVRDPANASVVHAAVHARELNTGATRHTVTNERGDYLLRALPIGQYEVSIETKGFKTAVQSGIALNVNASVRADFTIELGSISETVSVISRATQMETERGVIENRVLSTQMLQLPLNGRDPLELLTLNAGVDYGRSTNYFQISGNRDDSMNLQVEGTSSVNMLNKGVNAILPLDSVAEFVIKTSVPGADSGLGTAQVQIAMKSGTNQFHGSIYEFFRGNLWDARDFFNPTGQKAHLVRNQFGGSVGGPILHDRTFFFLNVEASRIRTAANSRLSLPTLDMRNGILSGTVKDPLNGSVVFPNARIPANRFDPLSQQFLNFMPLPTLPGAINNYFATIPNWTDSLVPVLKIDHQFTPAERASIVARTSFSRGSTPGQLPEIGGTARRDQYRSLSGRLDSIFSSRLLNQLSGGVWLYETESYPQMRDRDILGEFGLTAFYPASTAARTGFLDVRITGFPNISDPGSTPGIAHTQQYTLSDDISYIVGNHAIKAGGTIFWGRLDRLAVANLRGQFLYQGTLSGSPMADFLLGLPSSTGQDVGGDIGHMGRQYYAVYLMDDWKLTPRLTLNIGIRYELYTVPLEANNRLSAYNIPLASIVVSSDSDQPNKGVLPQFFGAASPLPIVSSKTAGLPRGLTNTDSNNWAPRFSFAYRLPSRKSTVVRGGYGWFYSPVRMETRMSQAVNNAPFLARMYFLNDIRFPLLNSRQASAAMGKTSTGGGTLMMQGLEQDFQDLMSQQWNFTIERDLGWHSSARISYVGNRGTHLPVNLNFDQDYVITDPVTKRPTLTRLDRRVNPINIQMSAARSWYHSLEAEFNRRFQKGVSVQANWTWGKNISDAETDTAMPQDSFCLRCDRADAAYLRRHMLKLNFVYDLPKPHMNRPLSFALNGWRLTGIGQLMTGVRYTPIYSRVAANADMRAGRPNLIGDPNNAPRTILQWYNTAAFAVPVTPAGSFASLTWGNAARNLVVGPGRALVDLSLQKQFKLSEKIALTYRFEVFNSLNHANFGAPALDLFLPTAGVISSTSTSARQTQMGLRIDF